MGEVGLLTAFLAGLASFLSPCVLPLVPGYLSFMSGVSVEEMMGGRGSRRWRILMPSVFFGLGFAAVFIAMGAVATTVGAFIQGRLYLFTRIAGVLIILFGLQLLGVFRPRFLMADRRYQGRVAGGLTGAMLLGMAFAFGWTPCVGPILFSILAYASTQTTVWRGVTLLAAYSAGLGLPFLLIGLSMSTFIRFLDRFKNYLRWMELASGVLLVVLGVMVMTGTLGRIADLIPPGCSPSG